MRRFFVLTLMMLGCSKKATTDVADAMSPGGDASADGGALATLVPVAEGPSFVTLHMTGDRRIVVLAGSLPFDARADGTLAPLVPPDKLAITEELGAEAAKEPGVGFFAPTRAIDAVRGDSRHALFFESMHRDLPLLVWEGGRVSQTAVRATHVVPWRELFVGIDPNGSLVAVGGGVAPPLPHDFGAIRELATSGDGRLAALDGGTRAVVWKTLADPTVVRTDGSCSFVPTFDGSVVIACGSYGTPARTDSKTACARAAHASQSRFLRSATL